VSVRIALVGDENETYPSHREINAVRPLLGDDVESVWVATDSAQVRDLSGFDGIWLVPGSPYRDDESAYSAVTWARVNNVPFLGTCGGMQYAVIEFVRNVLAEPEASHAESDGVDATNVVTALACSLQGKEREVRSVPGTRFARLVADRPFLGMHYCSYGPDPSQLDRLVTGGMVIEATADDTPVEVLELPSNDFFVLSLFQPQVGALAGKPVHPLLREFVRCAAVPARSARHGTIST
jgi:CTP synthase (UTP-ammonia lyase)